MVSTKVNNQTYLDIKCSGLDISRFSAKDGIFAEHTNIIKTSGGCQIRIPKDVEESWFVVRFNDSPLFFAIAQDTSFEMCFFNNTYVAITNLDCLFERCTR